METYVQSVTERGKSQLHFVGWFRTITKSCLNTTTFSINDGTGWNDIGVICHPGDNIVIYNRNN